MKYLKNAFAIFCLFLFSLPTFAQYQMGLIPRVSPDKGIYEKVGYNDVNITYGSPGVKGREVWGNLIAYDEVWRAGANNATTIEFSHDVTIDKQLLPKGKYSFFVIPKKDQAWIAIFSKLEKQWGSFRYTEEEDALRVNITPKEASFQENLSYTIHASDYENAIINLRWAKLSLEIPFNSNYDDAFILEVEDRAEKVPENIKWVVWLQGAEYLYESEGDLNLALKWLDKSDQLSSLEGEWNPQYYPRKFILGDLHWTRANILAKQGKFKAAVNSAQLAIKDKSEKSFYSRRNESLSMNQTIDAWKKGKAFIKKNEKSK